MVVIIGDWNRFDSHLSCLAARQLSLRFFMYTIVIIVTPTYLPYKVVIQNKFSSSPSIYIYIYVIFYYLFIKDKYFGRFLEVKKVCRATCWLIQIFWRISCGFGFMRLRKNILLKKRKKKTLETFCPFIHSAGQLGLSNRFSCFNPWKYQSFPLILSCSLTCSSALCFLNFMKSDSMVAILEPVALA